MLALGHPDLDRVEKYNQILSAAKDATQNAELFTTLWEDYYGDPTGYGNSTVWNPAAGLTNSGSVIAGDEGTGSVIYSTGATASSISGAAPANAIGATPWTVATQAPGKAFYLNCKAKIPTTPVANTTIFVGFSDTTNTLGVGVIGSLSTTRYIIQHSANLITTKSDLDVTPVDTAYHGFEMWANGKDGNVYARLDGPLFGGAGLVVSVTPTVTYTKLRLLVTARNGGTAADQRLQMAHLFVGCQP